jgi:hypothetical protein
MPTFVAFVRADLDNGFAVTFPDLLGLIVFAGFSAVGPSRAPYPSAPASQVMLCCDSRGVSSNRCGQGRRHSP